MLKATHSEGHRCRQPATNRNRHGGPFINRLGSLPGSILQFMPNSGLLDQIFQLQGRGTMLRDKIGDEMKQAMKDKERKRLSTLRLILAAINDRDIALRGNGKDKADDEEVIDLLSKMVKQREESSRLYKDGGRQDLADQEATEIEIIKEFLPEQLSDEALGEIITETIGEAGAESLRDMGKVMAILKERYRGQIDMGKAGALIKKHLGG